MAEEKYRCSMCNELDDQESDNMSFRPWGDDRCVRICLECCRSFDASGLDCIQDWIDRGRPEISTPNFFRQFQEEFKQLQQSPEFESLDPIDKAFVINILDFIEAHCKAKNDPA